MQREGELASYHARLAHFDAITPLTLCAMSITPSRHALLPPIHNMIHDIEPLSSTFVSSASLLVLSLLVPCNAVQYLRATHLWVLPKLTSPNRINEMQAFSPIERGHGSSVSRTRLLARLLRHIPSSLDPPRDIPRSQLHHQRCIRRRPSTTVSVCLPRTYARWDNRS